MQTATLGIDLPQSTSNDVATANWAPNLGGERVVEGIHYGWLMRDHVARYHFAAKYCVGKRVLDVATGTGYGANILRSRGAAEVVAADREEGALDYARQRYGTNGLRWVGADAYALPFASEFDVVVSFETIEHLKDPEQFVRECRRVLKPGGTFLVSTPLNEGGPYVSDFHEFEFTRAEFQALLGHSFSTVHLFGQRRELRTPIRLLGELPERYWDSRIRTGRGSHTLFTWMDRLNKAPNMLLAWASGLGESFRSEIRAIDRPLRDSALLSPNYYVMIAVCRARESSRPGARAPGNGA